METYLVGGAVRDMLLGYPCHERDWVVVGARVEDMLAQGFKPVGKDFPVFLHPKTKEEYALARTERKSGRGYKGFTFNASPDVTLEQDLSRRDLTINAMAQDANGQLIDPYGGTQDLKAKRLRHVSPAFAEDPLRVLRVARFAARYHHLGFEVAPETLELMRCIVLDDELEHLVAERVWRECEAALGERNPESFVQLLRDCGALARLLPELDCLFGVPQTEKYHPEIDTGVHVLMAVQQAVRLGASAAVRYAVLLHDLGKGRTPPREWPAHIAHEKRGVKPVEAIGKRLKVPKQFTELARLVAQYHTHCHRALEMRPVKVLALLEAADALRRPQRFEQFLQACEADARGRLGLEDQAYPQAQYLRRALNIVSAVEARELVAEGLSGKKLGAQLRQLRLERLQEMKAEINS